MGDEVGRLGVALTKNTWAWSERQVGTGPRKARPRLILIEPTDFRRFSLRLDSRAGVLRLESSWANEVALLYSPVSLPVLGCHGNASRKKIRPQFSRL